MDSRKQEWKTGQKIRSAVFGQITGKGKKDRFLIMLLCGVLLMVITLPVSEGNEPEEDERLSDEASGLSMDQYVQGLEEKLARALSRIDGAGEVSVMITWKSSAEKVVEKDEESTSETLEESDSQGGKRTTKNIRSSDQSVYTQDADSAKEGEPYVTKELSPAVEGVIVVAQGGANPTVVQNITEAVQALFSIDTHKIKVMKGNAKR